MFGWRTSRQHEPCDDAHDRSPATDEKHDVVPEVPAENASPEQTPAPEGIASCDRRDEEAADQPPPMCFTPAAYDELMRTVGSRPPETGAKGFGPVERLGFDLIEFDHRGSEAASGAVYSPDVHWGAERVKFWMNQPDDEMKVWTGDLHSHPGRYGRPSSKVATGEGDLGYAEEVFAQNPTIQWFALPILTNTGPGCEAEVNCWFVNRTAPHRPMATELRICDASEFPPREFNPEWEAEIAARTTSLDRDLLGALVGAELAWSEVQDDAVVCQLQLRECSMRLVLPGQFPDCAPELEIQMRSGWRSVPVRWWLESPRPLEARLLMLFEHTADYFGRPH